MYDSKLADELAGNYNVRDSQAEKKVLSKADLPFVKGGADIMPPASSGS